MPDAAAHELQRTVDEITGYSKRTRKLVWWLALLGVVALALSVVVAVLAVRTSDQAGELHKAQLSNCAASNGIRARETALWHTLFALSAANNNASHQKVPASTAKFLAQFLADVNTTFRQVDCAKAYPGG